MTAVCSTNCTCIMQFDDSDKCLLCLKVVKKTRRVFVVTFVTHGFILSVRILLCLILIVLHQLKSITIVVDACQRLYHLTIYQMILNL